MAVAPKRMTVEEFLKLPEEKPALEYIDGRVSQKVSPKTRHGILRLELAQRINAVSRQARIALAIPELRVTFAGASVVPDVAVYRWERMPRDSNGEVMDDIRVPPNVAIEIISPDQSANALVRRCRWYVANGVETALLVDPADRSVLAFLRGGVLKEWSGTDRLDLGPVVPDLDLTVEQLFTALAD